MSIERKRINKEAIKQSINLAEFARQYTQLKQISRRGEFAGPCPCCGGHDRFHVKAERFYCRKCYPRGGDVIDLVQLVEGVTFLEACEMLGTFSFSERQQVTQHETEKRASWQDSEYQESAQKTIAATQRLLLSENGTIGQEYLRSRGLSEETWQTYRLGYGKQFHLLRRQNMDAIFIPWVAEDDETITAIQHRFIDPSLERGERYALKPGSEPILFGLQALKPAEKLYIVEGEFNCMSLHQIGHQALSVGSESNVGSDKALDILHGVLPSYEGVIVWFDERASGEQFAGRLIEQAPFREEKIRTVSHGMDANELLVLGEL